MQTKRSGQSGYSLTEILVVLAIVGVLSLVTVPQFIAYKQSAALKGGMRVFTSDVRALRQYAITHYCQARIEFVTSTSYKFYSRPGTSGTWSVLVINGVRWDGTKTLSSPLTFTGNTFGDIDGNSKPDLIFMLDGTPSAVGSVTIGVPWKNIAQNRIALTVSGSGGVTVVGSHS
ncbi:MAG TPA: type II secretion system protein [Thermoanaerobaculia bacterium]|jgi:prepilin-type N-terminal cleavage/methylation domain-containing protein|nr:type II secretion system protein [Thermoanaerobaculia bacterium]